MKWPVQPPHRPLSFAATGAHEVLPLPKCGILPHDGLPLGKEEPMIVAKILEAKGHGAFTIAANASVSDAVELLNRHNVGALVVVNDAGKVSGILSERDIVRRLRGFAGALLSQPVSDLMTAKPITCTQADLIDDVMQLMTGRHFRHLPVVEDSQLVGVISIGDVVKFKIEATEGEAAALREYIAS
jgi:CBS domain-containing protein